MSNQSGTCVAEAAPDTQAPPLTSSRLLLVRHGESTWNRDRRIQGQLDPPLTERGQLEAREVAERLEGHDVVALYSSDLIRTMQTAAPIAEAVGMEPVKDVRLREIGLGEWEGRTGEELAQSYPDLWRRWTEQPSWRLVPGGEDPEAFEHRVGAVIAELFARHEEGDILVVTHGGVIQVALGQALGRSSDGVFPFLIDNCSLTVLERTRRGSVITAVNDTCHLP